MTCEQTQIVSRADEPDGECKWKENPDKPDPNKPDAAPDDGQLGGKCYPDVPTSCNDPYAVCVVEAGEYTCFPGQAGGEGERCGWPLHSKCQVCHTHRHVSCPAAAPRFSPRVPRHDTTLPTGGSPTHPPLHTPCCATG